MKITRSLPLLLLLILTTVGIYAQTGMEIDPETMKMMQNYQQQNQDVPSELLALMPKGLEISSKSWMMEPSSKMMFQLELTSSFSTKAENTEEYQLNLKINLIAYNLSTPGGKMIADSALKNQKTEVTANWTSGHQETKSKELVVTNEKITVPNGFIIIQKIYTPKHADGEGLVPERTDYCGFLYQDTGSGFLTAEIDKVPNSKTGIEKWLKEIAAKGSKIKSDKYFK